MSPTAVHAALLLTCGLTLLAWSAAVFGGLGRAERTIRLLEAGAALAAALVIHTGVRPDDLPAAWLATLHEGADSDLLRAVRAESTHAGPVWNRWWAEYAMVHGDGWFQPRLDGAVHLNLTLAPIVLMALIAVARRAAGWGGAALVLALAWQPVVRFSVLSESPAVIGWVWMALLGTALAATQDPRGWRRWAGVAAAVGATVLLAATRPELAVIGLAALAPPIGRRPAIALLAIAFVADRAAIALGGLPAEASWALRALDPTDPALLITPLFWVAACGPAYAALVVAGALRPGPAALSLVLLSRLYVAAGHGPALGESSAVSGYELLRYTGLIAPLLVATAVQGLRQVRWPAAALLALLPGVPGVLQLTPWTAQPALWSVTAPLDADLQREGRFVLEAMREHPDCAILTRGDREPWQLSPRAARSRADLQAPTPPRGDLAQAIAPLEGCVLLYVGATCARSPGACVPPEPGDAAAPLRTETSPPAPYLHPAHRAPTDAPLTLSLYRLR